MSLRLFGEEAAEYEANVVKTFGKPIATKEGLTVDIDTRFSATGSVTRIYRYKAVVCEVNDGNYRSFTYYYTGDAGTHNN